MDCSLPGSSIHGIFQARILEWGAIALSGAGATAQQQKIQTQSSADRITTSLSFAHQRKIKQTKNSAQISPYTKLTQTTGPTLGGQTLEAWEKETSTTIS